MELDGKQWGYSKALTLVDPDGTEQIETEEWIAAWLSDNYERCSQFEHICWIIQRVNVTFCPENHPLPVLSMLELIMQITNYLGNWRNGLEHPDNGPDDEEAGQAGKDLLLLVLRVLQPTYVQAIQISPGDSVHGAPKLRKQQRASLNWLPVTSQTLEQLPSYVAEMVNDLACGDENQTWALRELRYDWAAGEDLPITDGGMYEIWTRAWLRRGFNGKFNLSPVALSPREEKRPDVLAWIIERVASSRRRLIVWRVVTEQP